MPDVTININGRGVVGGSSDNGSSGTQSQPMAGSNGQPAMPTSGGSNVGNAQPSMPTSSTTTSGTPTGGTPAMPTYDRMAQDIRREIMSRGCLMVPGSSNFNQLMSTIQGQQRQQAYNRIDEKFTNDVTDTQRYYQLQQEQQLKSLEEERKKELAAHPLQGAQDNINRRYDARAKDIMDNITISQAQAFDKLQKDSDAEKAQVDKDLAKIAAELVQELKNQGGNSGSYLGILRGKYAEARRRRDNAETEEEVQDASREMADIQKRIARVTGVQSGAATLQKIGSTWGTIHGITNAVNVFPRMYANTNEEINELRSAANGDVFGTLEADIARRRGNWVTGAGAVGGLAGGILGGWWNGGMGVGIGAGLGSSIASTATGALFDYFEGDEKNRITAGRLISENERRIMAFSDYANILSQMRGTSLEDERNKLFEQSPGGDFINEYYGAGAITSYDLGIDRAELAQQVRQRVLQRGFIRSGDINGGVYDTLNSIALEKAYNMTPGSIGQLSSYDRYGNNANQDIANLIASLSRRGTIGMSNGQVFRANEFMNYQTQLMEMQKNLFISPNSKYAQQQLLSAQDTWGNSLDNRAIQQWGKIEGTLTNQAGGYGEAVLYDVIQRLYPDARGSIRKIREYQYSQNPKVRKRIQEELVKEYERIWGSKDTDSGYLSLSSLFHEENPYLLDKIISMAKKPLPRVSEGDVVGTVSKMKNYAPDSVKASKESGDKITALIVNELSGLREITTQIYNDFYNKMLDIAKDIKKVAND